MLRRILLHTVFWLTYWFVYAYTYSRYDGDLPKYLLSEALQMPGRILATYLSFWCFERFSGGARSGTWLAFGGAAAANLLGGLLNRYIKAVYVVPVFFPTASFDFWGIRIMYDLFDCVLASSTALCARMYFRQQALYRREAQLKAERAEAELKALKNQLHPHFLFNTINNLYGLARERSDKTAPVALKLAQVLRYVLYESQADKVPVSREIDLLEDYIALEQLRFDEGRLRVTFERTIDDDNTMIAPLLLLPLVENAFKHGAGEQRDDASIEIDIHLKARQLQLKVINSKPIGPPATPQGIGLNNLRRRLDLLYPGCHTFQVEDGLQRFEVNLNLTL